MENRQGQMATDAASVSNSSIRFELILTWTRSLPEPFSSSRCSSIFFPVPTQSVSVFWIQFPHSLHFFCSPFFFFLSSPPPRSYLCATLDSNSVSRLLRAVFFYPFVLSSPLLILCSSFVSSLSLPFLYHYDLFCIF